MNTNLKLKFYYEHVLGQVYAEGESPFHCDITQDVVARFIDPLNLPKHAEILDLGCGPGYFLDAMQQRDFTNVTGVSLSAEDVDTATKKQHQVIKSDMNFLSNRDESVDMLFCRHSLEHSPFPYITLLEYNRVLRPNGYLYIEVPAPDSERPHEDNRNHYIILGRSMWLSLLKRSGFDVTWYDYEFPITLEGQQMTEKYYVFVCQRKRPVDVK
jgi:SAM-dependent methyltransferase